MIERASWVLVFVLGLTSTPMRLAEAADDLARALDVMEFGDPVIDAKTGVGDDALVADGRGLA